MELHFQAAQHPDHFVLQHCCSKCTERKRTIHPSSSPRTAPSKAAMTTQCPVLCCSQPEGSCHQLLHPKHICTANQGLVLADDSSYQNKYIKGKRAASTMQMWQCIASLFLWEQLMVTSVASTKTILESGGITHWSSGITVGSPLSPHPEAGSRSQGKNQVLCLTPDWCRLQGVVGTTLSSAEQIKHWSKGGRREYKDKKNYSSESYYCP